MQRASSYIATLLIAAFGLSSIAAAINFVADPYGLFDLPPGLNVMLVKPEIANHERDLKFHRVTQARANGLILGASTSAGGLDPAHAGWRADRVYNLAIGQGSISNAYQLLMHAAQFEMPKQVVLGLDLSMFNPAMQDLIGLDPNVLAVRKDGLLNPEYSIRNYYASAWSIAMLRSSAKAIWATWQSDKKPSAAFSEQPTDSNGMLHPEIFATRQWIVHRDHFQRIIREYVEKFWAPLDEFGAIQDFSASEPFVAYRNIIRFACMNNIELHLVISPVHAYTAEAARLADLWPVWQRWQKALVIDGEAEARRSGCKPFPIWDFSGYNSITTESIAASVDSADEPRWYWDSAHYKKPVGDILLRRIFLLDAVGDPEDFGVQLDSATIDQHLENVAARGAIYRANHAGEIDLVRATVEAATAMNTSGS
jgi:hypothetical protein